MTKVRTVGVINGGGGAPGLNAVIRAVVRSATGAHGMRVLGIHNGFGGLIWPEGAKELTAESVSGEFNRMVCLRAGKVESGTLEEALSQLKMVDPVSEIVHAPRAIGTSFGDCA